MLTTAAHFVAKLSPATLGLIAASAINGALFLINVSFSRTLWRRRQALLKHENRLAPGPVTATIADRFSKRGATLSK